MSRYNWWDKYGPRVVIGLLIALIWALVEGVKWVLYWFKL